MRCYIRLTPLTQEDEAYDFENSGTADDNIREVIDKVFNIVKEPKQPIKSQFNKGLSDAAKESDALNNEVI